MEKSKSQDLGRDVGLWVKVVEHIRNRSSDGKRYLDLHFHF